MNSINSNTNREKNIAALHPSHAWHEVVSNNLRVLAIPLLAAVKINLVLAGTRTLSTSYSIPSASCPDLTAFKPMYIYTCTSTAITSIGNKTENAVELIKGPDGAETVGETDTDKCSLGKK